MKLKELNFDYNNSFYLNELGFKFINRIQNEVQNISSTLTNWVLNPAVIVDKLTLE